MNSICQFILSYYATGQSLRRICRGGVLLQYCEEYGIEIIDYYQVKAWLTNPHFDEDYKEFREQYAIIQKRMIPILIDELREDAEELQNTRVTGKYDVDRTDPRKWDGFRARFAVLKFLQSHHRTPKHTNPATRARQQAKAGGLSASNQSAIDNPQSEIQNSPAQNPTNPVPEGQIVNCKSSIVNNDIFQSPILKELSSLPSINLNLPKITLSQAKEILGSPILNEYDYSNDEINSIAQDFSPEISGESCAERMKEVYNFRELSPAESGQSASLSPQICEKPFVSLPENLESHSKKPELQSEIVNRTSEIVNQNSLCQNSLQPQTQTPPETPTIYRPIPNYHSRPNPNSG